MTTAARGRPRAFDPDEAIDHAVDVFWERGYRATTTRELEHALGIAQSSIYNTFGSKRALLLKAIDRYEERIDEELFCILTDGHGYRSVIEFFNQLTQWIDDNDHRGCLVVNLMASSESDSQIVERIQAYRRRIRSGFVAALKGEPSLDGGDLATRADLLLAAVLGIHTTARTADDRAEIVAMIRGVVDQVQRWAAAA